MKNALLPAMMLAAISLCAGETEIGLLLGKQMGKAQTVAAAVKKDPGNPSIVGLRIGFDLMGLGPAHLQLNGTYQPKAEEDFEQNGVKIGEKYGIEYVAAGASVYWRSLFSLGLGAEIRSEKIHVGGVSATYTRPWGKLHLGIAIPSPLLKPFVGLEIAAPFAKTDYSATNKDDAIRAFAPQLQYGIYGGIRF